MSNIKILRQIREKKEKGIKYRLKWKWKDERLTVKNNKRK